MKTNKEKSIRHRALGHQWSVSNAEAVCDLRILDLQVRVLDLGILEGSFRGTPPKSRISRPNTGSPGSRHRTCNEQTEVFQCSAPLVPQQQSWRCQSS